MRTSQEPAGHIALAIGPAVALAVAGLLDPVRDDFGLANVALVLSCIVVVAALAGRAAGLTTAVTAATAYNFFHTQPYHSLRIDAGRDIATVGLLIVIGIIVAEMSAWRRRVQAASERRLQGVRALESVAAQLADGATTDDIWTSIRAALIDTLGLADCRYEPGVGPSVAVLPRSGSLVGQAMRLTATGFELPAEGVAIPVTYASQTFGHIVLVPRPGSGSQRDIRQVAVALADEYAIALAGRPSGSIR
ncbi:MAG TPA: DUF4118 domain-containing protein [Ilumatobacteraceae bacterium]